MVIGVVPVADLSGTTEAVMDGIGERLYRTEEAADRLEVAPLLLRFVALAVVRTGHRLGKRLAFSEGDLAAVDGYLRGVDPDGVFRNRQTGRRRAGRPRSRPQAADTPAA